MRSRPSPPRRVCGVLAALGLLFGGGLGAPAPAAAVEEVPAAPAVRDGGGPPPYRLATLRLADGRSVPLRWNPCQVITFQVNVAAVPAPRRGAVLAEVRRAVDVLGEATGLELSYRGTTAAVPRRATVATQGAEIVIAAVDPAATDFGIGHGVVGYGGYRYWQWTTPAPAGRWVAAAAIARGWVVLDVAALERMHPGFGAGMTQGNVLLHELGHVVGLEHVGDPGQLMADTLTPTAPDGYAAGDRAGLALLGDRAGCLAVPEDVVTDVT